jgi:hypothetical protein
MTDVDTDQHALLYYFDGHSQLQLYIPYSWKFSHGGSFADISSHWLKFYL